MSTTFGIDFVRTDADARPAAPAQMSVIGLVGTAPDADVTVFPADTPVSIYSNDPVALEALGATGTLADAIAGIDAQLGDMQVAARIVVVRVAAGANDAATMAAVAGQLVGQTGVYAFLKAPALAAITPRLIGAPGFTDALGAGGTANPVVAALGGVLSKLLAHAVVDVDAEDPAGWRETVQSERIIPVFGPKVLVANSAGGDPIEAPFSARVLGIAVAVDHERGGVPSSSWANRAVQGIVGQSRAISFSLTDGATEGQALLAQNIGILVRGELGVEDSIGDGGFVFIGTDNTSNDPLWQFYNVTRMRDYIHLTFLQTLKSYLGRFNLTGQTIQAVRNTMNGALRDMQADGDLLGFLVQFNASGNSAEALRAGRFTIRFLAEEPPVLRKMTVESGRYAVALDDLLANLQDQAVRGA